MVGQRYLKIPTRINDAASHEDGQTDANGGMSPMRGLAFMSIGMFLFAASDTLAKFLTADFNPIQVMWSRQMGLVAGVIFFLALRGTSILRTPHLGLQITRGVVAAGSGVFFITALAYVPLADAMTVAFVAPFMVTIMGAFFLKEKVGIRRWTAVIIGFLATLIIIRPGMGILHPAVFLVIIAAGLFAVRQVISRAISTSDKTVTTVAYTALISCGLLTLPMAFVWQTPETGKQIMLLAALAATAGIAEVFVIRALQIAEAVVVAPVQYSLIIWGTMYGYFIFGDFPDFWTWIGAIIITATGIYTLYRESLAARRRKSATSVNQ